MRRDRPATILDVARLARVGKSTVSRVVNNDVKVNADTRSRVQAAMLELKYVPNLAAQQLKGSRPVRVGMVFAGRSSGFSYQVLRGALDQASRSNCQLVVSDNIGELVSAGVDCMVIGPYQYGRPGVVDSLRRAGIMVMCINAPGSDPHISTLRVDHEKGGRDVADHLLSLGHRRLAIIVGDRTVSDSHARLRGFLARLTEAGISEGEVLVEQGDFTFWSGLQAAERLLDRPDRPTAIFASNDDMAAGVLSIAHRSGLEIPEGLSVVGFDDQPLASEVWPALTTVRQNPRAMTATCIDLVAEDFRRRGDGAFAPRDIVWAHELIVRDSTGAAPV